MASMPESVKGPTKPKDMHSELRRLLECPICTRPVCAPVYQCTSGHVICTKCKESLPQPKKCPSCRVILGDIRVRALESLAETVPYPCENVEYGCPESLPAPTRAVHEENCKYALFVCPNPTIEDCKWTGKASQVVGHLADLHEIPASSFNFGPHEEEWCLTCDELGEGDYWLYTSRVKGKDFILYARECEGRFHVNIRHIGFETISHCRIRMKLKEGFENIQNGPILSIRKPQHEGFWFSAVSDMIKFNPGGGMSIFITIDS
eukprot:128563_1